MDSDDEKWETMADGKRVIRGEDGRILKTDLPSETAQHVRAGKKWEKASTLRDELLAEVGYPDPTQAPPTLRVLCEAAAVGGVRSVGAVVALLRETRKPGESAAPKAAPGKRCPTCNQFVMGDKGQAFWNGALEFIISAVEEVQDKKGEPMTQNEAYHLLRKAGGWESITPEESERI